MKDFITIHENGKKKRLRKHCLTIYLRKAHSFFVKSNPDITISFSAFAKLKPKSALLLKDTQLDRCRCETHENLIFKLTNLKICYHDNFRSRYLCDDELSSDFLAGQCEECFNGKKIDLSTKSNNNWTKIVKVAVFQNLVKLMSSINLFLKSFQIFNIM